MNTKSDLQQRLYQDIDSPLGRIRLVTDGQGLTGCYFHGQKYFPVLTEGWEPGHHHVLEQTHSWLLRYFHRQPGEDFPSMEELSLTPKGTDFQQQVWQVLLRIQPGTTWIYSDLAVELHHPSATRAVAAAIGKNPISVIIPCHRVIGKNRSLTGYAGGLDRKHALLELEGAFSQSLL
ncbi:methylated-DNA--[protein]-cysteine S-methyltransferase [Hahella ganghwensis]|uniref:methylated-DNA--[protein]-cysteine S-methyltransferase n=1 Tax=Hahella ganghwensis TaxID=286420 RepID=UPI0003827593|nr:methylated-DNA--[protein]-cysteine S-methyltransferase [Hahella ganghwensis]